MIFVFGSNLAGVHGAGAAKHAIDNYGAEWGVGRGMTGQSYALPTKDENLKPLPWHEIRKNLNEFFAFAKNNPNMIFALTPVGTGYAGYSKAQLAREVRASGIPSNVYLTGSWLVG